LAPYENWIHFGQALKHPESLANFIAAYGTHPNIMGLDPDGSGPIAAGSLKARRIAAQQLVDGEQLPGPDRILLDNPLTRDQSADNLPGIDETLGTDDDLPGPDGILLDNPATQDINEAADNILAPANAEDFLFSTGGYANNGTTSRTGL